MYSTPFRVVVTKVWRVLKFRENLSARSARSVYEHDDILGDTWLNDAGAIFVPLDENILRCHTCGTTVATDMLMDHTCPASFKLKRATGTMTLSENDLLRRLHHNLAREELESMESAKFLTATTFTKSHAQRRSKLQQELVETIVANKKELGEYAEVVPDDKWEGRLVPKLFKILGGTKTQAKIVMASNLLWRLLKDMKNTRAKEGECPYLEPDTENVKLRTLMAVMKEEYNWEYQLDRDFNFEGGFAGRMRVL